MIMFIIDVMSVMRRPLISNTSLSSDDLLPLLPDSSKSCSPEQSRPKLEAQTHLLVIKSANNRVMKQEDMGREH